MADSAAVAGLHMVMVVAASASDYSACACVQGGASLACRYRAIVAVVEMAPVVPVVSCSCSESVEGVT